MKILHGPKDTAGLAVSSAKYEAKIGLDSHALLFFKKKMGSNNFDIKSNISFVSDSQETIFSRIKLIKYQFQKIRKEIMKYDIISLTDGETFLGIPYLNLIWDDLKYLKRKGKKIVITYQGCEIRLAPECKKMKINACKNCPIPKKYFYDPRNWNLVKKRKIRRYDELCDLVFYHNPDLRENIPQGYFRPYMKVDYREWIPVSKKKKNKKIVIGHAPKNREIKGTKHVLQAIKNLKERRNDFEFVLLENIPYHEVIHKYKQIDLFIDQLNIGWYGGVAVELMALEKPVIAYIRESDLKNVPVNFANDLPIINANLFDLTAKIEFFLDNPEQIRIQGKISREFVMEYHDPIEIAKWLKQKYESIL